jgi:hypothetical protein
VEQQGRVSVRFAALATVALLSFALLGGSLAPGAEAVPGGQGPHHTPKPKPTPTATAAATPTPTVSPNPTPTATPVPPPGLTQLSSDPYTNSTSQHATEVEPDIAAFGSTLVAVFQVGRFFDGGSSNIGWATSTNNGASWTHGFLPGITKIANAANPYDRATDPAVAYDAKHGQWLVSTLALTSSAGVVGKAVLTSRSADGLTWGSPIVTATATGTANYDKNWIGCDDFAASPFYGNCYQAWDDNGAGNRFLVSTSSDGGLSWGGVVSNGFSVLGVQPVVQPNGNVVVVSDSGSEGAIYASRSTNGGASFGAPVQVAAINQHGVAGGLRAPPLVSSAMDGAGRIYAAWADCRFRAACTSNDVVYSSSTDGVTWTAVARVPIDPTTSGADHFLPGIGIDPTTSGSSAGIGLTYYFYPLAACTSATCQLEVGFVSSANGGSTWSAPTTLAGPMTLSWLASTSQGTMVGDYFATAISAHLAFGVFAVAFAPSGGVFNEAMYTTSSGLALSGGSFVNVAVPVASAQGQSTAAQHRN